MNKIRKLASCLALFLLSPAVLADSVSIPYAGFYERLKQVNKNNYQLVEVVFSVPRNENCKIISGSITTEKHQYPLTYDKQQRLYLPFDAQLKSDRGLINLQVSGDASQCGVAMQVRAKKVQSVYNQDELVAVKNDMDALLDGQQGFPMKYFRKPITGLTFSFASTDLPVETNIDGKVSIVSDKLQLTSAEIETIKQLSFSKQPIILSPYVN
ncbi:MULTISPECIES: DUF2987 domain-containing protein [Shewanella]|uniref:DUF2987 domain-containing protein n=1 Tax=Shewanella TaxID=22 RepID=UPI000E75B349|nr:DUF2987 domain-containing protein [Shewanella japonica]